VGPVVVVVGRPEHVNVAPGVGRGDEGGRLCVGSAGHSNVVGALDGAGVADLTDGGVWDELSSGDGTLVGLAVDGDLGDNPVSLGEREEHEGNKEGEGGEEESGGLHCSLSRCGDHFEGIRLGRAIETRARKRPVGRRKEKRE
jgi:hypothetical protein